jgi:hypothetical protein
MPRKIFTDLDATGRTITATTFSGNASTVTNGVYTTGNQTIGGEKTFSGALAAVSLTASTSTAQYPVGLTLIESSHATSRRAALSLGSQWQIGADSVGNGTRDFFLYGNGAQRLGISTAGLVTIPGELNVTGNVIYHTTIVAKTASYTLVLADDGDVIEMNVGSANTVTIPLNSSVAFPVGTQITILQTGTGQTSLAVTSGVTLNATPQATANTAKLRAQWSSVTLLKRGTDTWVAMGDLAF